MICRICYGEEIDPDRLVSPCKCTGSVEYAHPECIDRWRTENQLNFFRCNMCNGLYNIFLKPIDIIGILVSKIPYFFIPLLNTIFKYYTTIFVLGVKNTLKCYSVYHFYHILLINSLPLQIILNMSLVVYFFLQDTFYMKILKTILIWIYNRAFLLEILWMEIKDKIVPLWKYEIKKMFLYSRRCI